MSTKKEFTLRELHDMAIQASVFCLIGAASDHLKTPYLEYRDFPTNGWDIMSVELLDTVTMETRFSACFQSPFSWAENNWSCDCNRADLFDVDIDALIGGIGTCAGSRRFIIVDYVNNLGGKYTMEELNDDYPKDLLDKHRRPDWK